MIRSSSTKAHQVEQYERAGLGQVVPDEVVERGEVLKPGRVLLGDLILEGDCYQVSASGVWCFVHNVTRNKVWVARLDNLVKVALAEGLE